MKEPDGLVAWLARRILRESSVDRVAMQALADLRLEAKAAALAGARWRACWIRLTGTLRLVQALSLQAASEAWRGPAAPSPMRGVAIAELVGFTCLAFVVLCFLLWSPARALPALPKLGDAERAWLLVCFIPSLVVSLLPASFLPGALFALRRSGGAPTARDGVRLLFTAWLLAGLVFALAAWTMPRANERVHSTLNAASGQGKLPLKAPRDQTIGELSQLVRELEGTWPWATARYRVELHKRFALPASALAFAVVALGLKQRGLARSAAPCLVATVAVVAGDLLLRRIGEQAGLSGAISPALGPWLGNLALTVLAVGLLAPSGRWLQGSYGRRLNHS
jgi:lipopolysaccharide export LptBFGC system permease protein LptF